MTRESHGVALDRTRVGHCKRDPTDVYAGRGPGGRDMAETPIASPATPASPRPTTNPDSLLARTDVE